jgi:hypothetical protein
MIGSHNSPIGLTFYNDRVKEIIDAGIIAEPFTYIPIKAGHMELVGGNALVFGKITEGYDIIAPDIDTVITYEDKSGEASRVDLSISYRQTVPVVITYEDLPNWFNNFTYNLGDKIQFGADRFYTSTRNNNLNKIPTSYSDEVVDIDPNNRWWRRLQPFELNSYRTIYGVVVIRIPLTIYAGSYYYISVENTEKGIASMTAAYKAEVGDTINEVKAGLILDLTEKGFIVSTGIPSTYEIFLYPDNRMFKQTPSYEAGTVIDVYLPQYKFSAYVLSLGFTNKYPSLKCGATHGFGIVYKDRAGRVCSVMKNDSLSIYIPFYTEAVTNNDNLLESLIVLTFKINHKPPEWAESYEIVYFGNLSMDYFLQIRANNINNIGSHRYSMNIQETIDDTQANNNRWKLPPYVWNPDGGDRVRLMGTVDESTGVVTKYAPPLYYGAAIGADFMYDYEIEATDTQYNEEAIGGDWLIFQAVEHPIPFEGTHNILVEVYRPRKGLGLVGGVGNAYGTGMVFEVKTDAYGNKYHEGDVDQVINNLGACTVPAEVKNTANDCWKYIRLNYEHNTANVEPFWAESTFPSDWWGNQIVANKLTSQGFPFLDDLSQRQTILDERIRHGGFLITGTRTNNIAHFTFDDFMDLPKKNGDIMGLREVGFTLKVIQMYKETSIYINRIQTFNPDGTEQFTLTDKFLAEQRPMDDEYGCQHPDSIMVNGRNLYYWDNTQGVFIRSSPNGQTVLDIKMKRWFKDIVKWISTSGGKDLLQVRVGANNEHEEVWLTFRMGDEVKGVIFSEKQGRFITRINQITETYMHLGNFFGHLYNQRLWIMNIDEGQDYLSWNGVPTYAEIEAVSNIEPQRNKVYNAIALFSDHELNSLPKYVYIPAEASAGNSLMESNIPIWDRREGVFYGEILKDENSKGNFISLNDRKMNGNAMRGRYCFVKLNTEEHTEKVRIDSIVIMSTLSERNV